MDLGIRLAVPGARTVCYVEREAYACAILVARMSEGRLDPAPVWTDQRTFDGRPWRGVVDLVAGGIPCVGHSVAGKKLGLADERDLWSDTLRIVGEVRPRWCFFENSANLLNTGFYEVARELRGLGYRVAATRSWAEEVGAPHERARLFVLAELLADPDDLGQPQPGGPDDEERRRARDGGAGMAHPDRERGGEPKHAPGAVPRGDAGTDLGRGGGELADGGRQRGHPLRPTPGEGEPRAILHDQRRDPWVAGHGPGLGWRAGTRELADPHGEHAIDGGPGAGDAALREARELSRLDPGGLADPVREQPAGRSDQHADAGGQQPTAPGGDGGVDEPPLFPPGRGAADHEEWWHLLRRWPGYRPATDGGPKPESAVRGVPDGLAAWVGDDRAQQIRLVGNGVVPLVAAYALRALYADLRAGERGGTDGRD